MKILHFKGILVNYLVCLYFDIVHTAPSNLKYQKNMDQMSQPIDSVENDPELLPDFFEGDMNLASARNGIINDTKHWPNNAVYYRIDEEFDIYHMLYIVGAMRSIESVSCIRFYPTNDDINAYVYIQGDNTGCHSKVGYQGVPQVMNLRMDPLNTGCFKFGTVIHELLHALGFYHQQSAADRDSYVRIVPENIKPSKLRNFRKYSADVVTDFGVPYDYYSVMHYSEIAFSRNGEKTIIPLLGEDIRIGQRIAMSPGDVAKLNIMYNCWRPETIE